MSHYILWDYDHNSPNINQHVSVSAMADCQRHILVVAAIVVFNRLLLGAPRDYVIVEFTPLLWTKHKLINKRESSN